MTRARDVANLIGSGNYSSTTFTATAGQTVFSIAHTQNFVQVFMNGLLLDLTVDYTSNGSAVTLTSGAAVGDEIEVVAYNTFSVGDALNQAAADTRYVNTTGDTMTGAFTLQDTYSTAVTNASTLIANASLTINGNSGQGSDVIRMGPMCSSGAQYIDASNGAGSAAYALCLNPINGGNVGIGTTAPLRQLHISNTSANSEIAFTAATNGVSSLLFGDGQTGTDIYRGYLQYNHSADAMLFATAATERMRIDANSNFLFGLTTANSFPTGNNFLQVNGVSGVSMTLGGHTGTHTVMQFRHNGATTVGSIVVNGSSTTYNTSSDYRLKENLTNISDGITRVKQLKPKRFNFIVDADKTVDGFLAHEASTVVPEAVTGEKDGLEVWKEKEKDELPDGVSVGDNKLDADGNTIPEYQGLDQSKLVPLLTAALQEAIAKIETLETRVAALEGG